MGLCLPLLVSCRNRSQQVFHNILKGEFNGELVVEPEPFDLIFNLSRKHVAVYAKMVEILFTRKRWWFGSSVGQQSHNQFWIKDDGTLEDVAKSGDGLGEEMMLMFENICKVRQYGLYSSQRGLCAASVQLTLTSQ